MTLRQKLEQLIASWPDDRGDKPDTDYQRGYMAAAEEHARELADALRTPAAAADTALREALANALSLIPDRPDDPVNVAVRESARAALAAAACIPCVP